MTEQEKAKIEFIIQSLADDADIQKLVKEIEARPATTQYHYGDYGAVISSLSNGSKTTAYVLAQAMKRAGGNSEGIDWAFKLFV